MLQMMLCWFFLGLTALVLLYGAYCLALPRVRAKVSLGRLFYRIVMAIRRRPAKPVSRFRVIWFRCVGALCLVIGAIWAVSLHPEIRLLDKPLYDAQVNRWTVEQGDGSPEEADVLARLEQVTQSQMSPSKCLGMYVGVICDGKTYLLAVGRKTLGREERPDADTEFEIGSITKVFTSTALSALCKQGVVTLDQPLESLLPAGWTVPERDGRKITLEDLATHHSGLPRVQDASAKGAWIDTLLLNPLDDPYRNMTQDYLRDWMNGYTLTVAPGEKYEYSNLGAGLLGFGLANKTQQSYESLITEIICDPLNMPDTRANLNREQTGRLAQGYMGHIALGNLCIAVPMTRWTLTEPFQAAGCICSTPRDMLKFVAANINAPEGPVGEALAQISERRNGTVMKECDVGLAMHIQNIEGIDGLVYWHNGGTGGYNSFMAFTKNRKTGVVMLASGLCPEEFGVELLKALEKKREAAAPAA